MCIIFLYNGQHDTESDYSLIMVSNRDEYYKRPAQCLGPWDEDNNIYGGRDLELDQGGTWLAVNMAYKKIGVLLNLPGSNKENSVSRGKIVTDYVKNATSAKDYVESLKSYDNNCNGFVLVTLEFGILPPVVQTYNNVSNETQIWTDEYLGFSNNIPNDPLKKVGHGKCLLREICSKYKTVDMKNNLIKELQSLLENKESQLPDPQLEKRQPNNFKALSSIFVEIPGLYGTRAHTIFILTKSGHIDLIEYSMESPIVVENPTWKISKYEFDI